MRIVNPATGNVLSVEYTNAEEARRAAHLMADDMGLDLELHPSGPHSPGEIELIRAEE